MLVVDINKIKYKVLDEIIPRVPRSFHTINFHIDLNSLLRIILAPTVSVTSSQPAQKVSLASSIINIVAHYREYYYRQGKLTKFYLYYNDRVPSVPSELLPEYGEKYFAKLSGNSPEFMGKINYINDNLDKVEEVIQYVQNVYILRDISTVDGFAFAHYTMQKNESKQEGNIILTKDPIWYQLLSNPRTFVIYPKRDESFVIDQSNIFDNSYKKHKDLTRHCYLSVMCLEGVKTRNIPKIKNYKDVLDYAKTKSHVPQLMSRDESFPDFKVRLKSLSASYQSLKLSFIEKSKIDQQLSDRYSYDKLRDFNDNEFKHPDNILLLEELVRGDGGLDNDKYSFEWKS